MLALTCLADPHNMIVPRTTRARSKVEEVQFGPRPQEKILSVHARFSMSDSFVDLPQEVVN